jgi:hypothetical protein
LCFVQRERGGVRVAIICVHLCDCGGNARGKCLQQFFGLALELIQIRMLSQRAKRRVVLQHELLSWPSLTDQPLRPVSACSGRKEFIETGSQEKFISGGRSPFRGHGGALKRA